MKVMVAGTNETVEVSESIDGKLVDEDGAVYVELHDVGGTKFFQKLEDQVEHVVASVENEAERLEGEIESGVEGAEDMIARHDGIEVTPEADAGGAIVGEPSDGVADAPDDAPEAEAYETPIDPESIPA